LGQQKNAGQKNSDQPAEPDFSAPHFSAQKEANMQTLKHKPGKWHPLKKLGAAEKCRAEK
jgi:hypothetical protein